MLQGVDWLYNEYESAPISVTLKTYSTMMFEDFSKIFKLKTFYALWLFFK